MRTVVLGNFEAIEQSGLANFESDLTVAQEVGHFFSVLLEQFSRVPPDAHRDLLRQYPRLAGWLAGRLAGWQTVDVGSSCAAHGAVHPAPSPLPSPPLPSQVQ